MIDQLFIFGAKYLIVFSGLCFVWHFFKLPRESWLKFALFAASSFALAFVISVGARQIYDNPRPFVIGNFEPLIPHEPDNGFPSDHMLLASALASVLVFYSRSRGTLLWVIAIFIGISRIYAGVHHSLDILGSAMIAIISTLAAYAIIHQLWNKNKTKSLSL